MREAASGRTGVSFTTEFVSIILMFVMLCVCHGEISVMVAVWFSKLRVAMLFCTGYQAFVVT